MNLPTKAVAMERLRAIVIVVARENDYRSLLAQELTAAGYEVLAAADRAEAITLIASRKADVIVADVQATHSFASLPDNGDVPVVIIASKPTESALRTLRTRASAVLTKPLRMEDLREAVAGALATAGRGVGARPGGAAHFVSKSPAMRKLLDQVERLRDADCPVLILGETGTGKTVLARWIHAIGARAGGAFVDLNCAGLTTEFVESELFGHERGSFTGAHAAKAGLFDVADNGTLFLDEIGDIDMRVQPRILKILEEKRYRRMGDVRERTADVRLLAATNVDLLASVSARTFRADLYYRISTIRLVVPALRERREDIVPLALEMLERMGHGFVALTRDAETRLLEYPWPGNIRELKNVVESSTLLREGNALTGDDLRFDVAPITNEWALAASATTGDGSRTPESVSRLLAESASGATSAEIEREHIRVALTVENGRVEAAARRLGIPRSTLYWKLKRFGMKANGNDVTPAEGSGGTRSDPDAAS